MTAKVARARKRGQAVSDRAGGGRASAGALAGAPKPAAMAARTHQDCARRVLNVEAAALHAVRDKLDASFDRAVDVMAGCTGKVVVAGMGKSGIMCRKIAATLASTGTPALFLHAAEGAHGDSGMLMRGDVALLVSYSGETSEVVSMLPLIKRLGLALIVMTGRSTSTLARAANVVLDIGVSEEACPLGLAPTASTTATVALGDSLALALLEHRGFQPEDFAILHPGGALGRRLLLRVCDLMHRDGDVPWVSVGTLLKDALLEMTTKRLGVTGVCDERGALVGIITDGDLRRGLERTGDIKGLTAGALMTADPKTIHGEALAAEAVAVMERHAITSLFVLEDGRPIGLIHLHDLLRAGVV
jgi:arabinose-5-phosphate isomerase